MDDNELKRIVRELKDKQEIYDCMARFARGVDRLDRELLLSVFHPDAIDDHGSADRSPEEFADWVLQHVESKYSEISHTISNHLCEIEGDTAHAETYVTCFAILHGGGAIAVGGRYIDRLERREGKWAIVVRRLVYDWRAGMTDTASSGNSPAPGGTTRPSARDRTDPSYDRPLR